jgi:hypothetical protein
MTARHLEGPCGSFGCVFDLHHGVKEPTQVILEVVTRKAEGNGGLQETGF